MDTESALGEEMYSWRQVAEWIVSFTSTLSVSYLSFHGNSDVENKERILFLILYVAKYDPVLDMV
jgi:hypothetical protein